MWENRQQLTYKGATYGGNSGSPVYWMRDKRHAMVAGIHTGGSTDSDQNYATLIRTHIPRNREQGNW